ncbi:MAG: VTT domain-containing protein [Verrucomicrobiales bacterium]|nr:VTT domain-containing protein [Verrucomicrobiales bacterium]
MTPEVTHGLPLDFAQWGPVAQATTLGLATFVQEDVPTVTAAVLAGTGALSRWVGLLGCFLGIWGGDALLYLLARSFGRPLLRFSWAARLASPESIARSEHWFAEKGTWLLVSSRFVPGTRLPTYLAAGFLRAPFHRFLLVTGVVVAIWTAGIFSLGHVFGPQLGDWMRRWNTGGWVLLPIIALASFGLRWVPRMLRGASLRRWRAMCGRWLRWEFWPAWLFYLPVGLNYARLALKYRSLTLPSAANPGIATGGLVGESKFDTLEQLHSTCPDHTAESWLLPPGDSGQRRLALDRIQHRNRLTFPFILKPDVGQRGVGVKLIRNAADAMQGLESNGAALVVQRYVPGPLEAGLFYYRFPHEPRGRIFAITEKVFPSVTGDGVRTVEELIWQDPRARFVAGRYLARFADRREEVLPRGQSLRLVEAGNHAQGCIFRDGSHWWTPELEARVDEISRRIPGFFIGRFDVRFESEAEFRAGRGFQILELNGAAAEATNIYDERCSLRAAYATLFRQWELVFAIGAANRERGAAPTPPLQLWRLWRETQRRLASYPLAD